MAEFDIQEIVTIIKRRALNIVAPSLSLALIFFVFASSQPKTYETSVAFTIKLTHRNDSTEFNQYYAIKSGELVGDTIISWFMTPADVAEIYDKAGLKPFTQDQILLTRHFKTTKFSGQNLVVKFKEDDEPSASKLAAALSEYVKSKAESLNKDSQGNSMLQVEPSKPFIALADKRTLLWSLAGLFGGLMISFAGVMIHESVSKKYAHRG